MLPHGNMSSCHQRIYKSYQSKRCFKPLSPSTSINYWAIPLQLEVWWGFFLLYGIIMASEKVIFFFKYRTVVHLVLLVSSLQQILQPKPSGFILQKEDLPILLSMFQQDGGSHCRLALIVDMFHKINTGDPGDRHGVLYLPTRWGYSLSLTSTVSIFHRLKYDDPRNEVLIPDFKVCKTSFNLHIF